MNIFFKYKFTILVFALLVFSAIIGYIWKQYICDPKIVDFELLKILTWSIVPFSLFMVAAGLRRAYQDRFYLHEITIGLFFLSAMMFVCGLAGLFGSNSRCPSLPADFNINATR